MKKAVIELDGLGVRFGRHQILNDLRGSLAGRAIGLLGPNGAGKTTLLHTLLGFHPASAGTARIFGHDIRSEIKAIREGKVNIREGLRRFVEWYLHNRG